ncbi:MAG: GAF domain-containing SpoIIE family protein phosphatase [Candidatus Zixiibacteriota bacterium]
MSIHRKMISADQTPVIEALEARLEEQKAQLRDLATMGAVVTSILEIDAVLSVTMDMGIRLVNGEVGLILLEEGGELKNKVCWGVSESFVKSLLYEDGLDIASYCFARKESVVLSDLGLKSESGMVLQSVMACPIQTQEKCLGVMTVINKFGGGDFTESDQESLSMLLNFVAVSVENSHLVKDKLKQQKIAQEMAIAKQVQETILADDVGQISGAEIGAVYFPAGEVGGDFYDVLKLSDSAFMVVLGDVSNKGIPAALVMSACSGVIKSILDGNPGITVSELARRVNRLMAGSIIKEREMFVTMFFARFDLERMTLTYCNAGHLPGLFWDESSQAIVSLADGGSIVGQFAEAEYRQGERPLRSGDRLFLFTDGLTEAADFDNKLFGRERAEQVFTSEIELPPNEFCHRVKEWVDRFSEGAAEDSHDDFTILQVLVK